MSGNLNRQPPWPTKFLRYEFPKMPFECMRAQHLFPCGAVICEWSDGTIRQFEEQCACGCDPFTDWCMKTTFRSV